MKTVTGDAKLFSLADKQLPAHRLVNCSSRRLDHGCILMRGFNLVKIDVEGELVEDVGDSPRMPSGSASLEPAQMPTQGCCQKNGVGVLLELLVGESLLDSNLE
jgi:hypothetical protein